MDIPEDLQTLKRPALQKLCKAYNIKANMKNASMIKALLAIKDKSRNSSGETLHLEQQPENDRDEQSLCKDVCGGTSTNTVSYESNEQTKEEETGSVLEVQPDEEKYQLEEDNSSTRMSLDQQDHKQIHVRSGEKEFSSSIEICYNEEQREGADKAADTSTYDEEPRDQEMLSVIAEKTASSLESRNTTDTCSVESTICSLKVKQNFTSDGTCRSIQDCPVENSDLCPGESSNISPSVDQTCYFQSNPLIETNTDGKQANIREQLTNSEPNFTKTGIPPHSQSDTAAFSSGVVQKCESEPEIPDEDEPGDENNCSSDNLNTTFTIDSPEKQVLDPLVALNESLSAGSTYSTPLQGSWLDRDSTLINNSQANKTFTKDSDHASCVDPQATASLIKSAVIVKDSPLIQSMKKDEKENVGSQHDEIMAILNSRVEKIINDPNYVPEIGSTTVTSKIPIKKNTVTGKFNRLHNKHFNKMESIDQTFEKRKRKLDTTDGPPVHTSKKPKVQTGDIDRRQPVKAMRKTTMKSTIDRLATPKHQTQKSFTQQKGSHTIDRLATPKHQTQQKGSALKQKVPFK